MTSKNVFVGNWSYIMPDTKANSNGRIILIKKLSFGPCEVYEWGIDSNGLPYEEYKWCENEFYKDETACLPYRFYSFIRDKGFIDLFKDHIERDYVWVEDLCEVLYQTMIKSEFQNGIYNLGGNHPVATRKVAEIVIECYMEMGVLEKGDVQKYIQLIDMPESLRGKFQFYTHADKQLEFISDITVGNEQKRRNYVLTLIDKKV